MSVYMRIERSGKQEEQGKTKIYSDLGSSLLEQGIEQSSYNGTLAKCVEEIQANVLPAKIKWLCAYHIAIGISLVFCNVPRESLGRLRGESG